MNGAYLFSDSYLESVDTLYSTNTFHPRELSAPLPDDFKHDFLKPNQITLLRAVLLPRRFDQISRLNIYAFSTSIPPHPTYERVCRSVLALPGLRELRLAVAVSAPRWAAGGRTGGRGAPFGDWIEVPAGPALDAAWLGVIDSIVAERRLGFVEFVVGESWFESFDRKGAQMVRWGGEIFGRANERSRFWRRVVEEGKELGYWVADMLENYPLIPCLGSGLT